MNGEIDVRSILPTIRVPTLVLQRKGDVYRNPGHAQYLAEQISSAKLVVLPGSDHLPYVGDGDVIVDEIQEFLTGVRPAPHHDRVLATVLFAAILESTQRVGSVGDAAWKKRLQRNHLAIGQQPSR